MSAQQIFALCIDCWEMHYGISDANGVYSRESGSTNHWDHAVHVFGKPDDYVPPIRAVLTHLAAGLPVSDGRLEMFSLACALSAVQPTNGIKVTFGEAAEVQGTKKLVTKKVNDVVRADQLDIFATA